MKPYMEYWSLLALGALFVPFVIGCFSASTQESISFLEYHRSGGFMGLDDHLIIDDDGTAVLTRKRARSELTVDAAVMDQLRSLLDGMAFSKLRKQYLPSREGADLFDYVITYGDHTVQTKDTAIPEALQPLIELLDRIISTG